jgi:Holliday junction DNA helicase RuvB
MQDSPKNDVNDVTPSSLKHLVGQASVKAQVAVALDAAFQDGTKFPDSLLVGPPGLGKSAFAAVIAQEMAGKFHEVLAQSLGPAEMNGLLLSAEDKSVVFLDEIHELKPELQTALYLALDKRMIFVASGKPGTTPMGIPIANFTLVLATTDEYRVLQPLRDRMKLVLRLDFYNDAELTTVLLQRSRALGWDVHEEILPLVARRSRGTPRLALRLLAAARRCSRSQGETTITVEHLKRACLLEQLDELGCGPTEQKYLKALLEGASRLNVLASLLGLPSRTVSEVVEPFLIRAGLVIKDDAGRRQLTALGRDHLLSNSRQNGV